MSAQSPSQQSASELADIDFKGLVMGLSGAALHHLGETKTQPSNGVLNLPLARQNIEIIAMLSEKTKGNLTLDEEAMIQQILLDLRMRFVEKSKLHSTR